MTEEVLPGIRWGDTRGVLPGLPSKEEIAKFERLVACFRKYGDKYDMDYLLMMAQGYQESRLNQKAKSPVGAIGVMQVMPATGKEMDVGDITHLEPNINAGVKYMRFMMDQFYANEPMDALNKGGPVDSRGSRQPDRPAAPNRKILSRSLAEVSGRRRWE